MPHLCLTSTALRPPPPVSDRHHPAAPPPPPTCVCPAPALSPRPPCLTGSWVGGAVPALGSQLPCPCPPDSTPPSARPPRAPLTQTPGPEPWTPRRPPGRRLRSLRGAGVSWGGRALCPGLGGPRGGRGREPELVPALPAGSCARPCPPASGVRVPTPHALLGQELRCPPQPPFPPLNGSDVDGDARSLSCSPRRNAVASTPPGKHGPPVSAAAPCSPPRHWGRGLAHSPTTTARTSTHTPARPLSRTPCALRGTDPRGEVRLRGPATAGAWRRGASCAAGGV